MTVIENGMALWRQVPDNWGELSIAERREFDALKYDRGREEQSPETYNESLPFAWRGHSILFRLYTRALNIQMESEYRDSPVENPNNPNHDYEHYDIQEKEVSFVRREDELLRQLDEGTYQPSQEHLERAAYSLDLWGHLEGLEDYVLDGIIMKAPCDDFMDVVAFNYRKKRRELKATRAMNTF